MKTHVFQDTVIECLKITRCGLNVLHSTLGDAPWLKKLVLHSNELKVLPDSIGELKKLQSCDLSANKLEHLPDSVGRLPNLNTLLLSHNEATIFFFFQDVIMQLDLYSVHTAETNKFCSNVDLTKALSYIKVQAFKIFVLFFKKKYFMLMSYKVIITIIFISR